MSDINYRLKLDLSGKPELKLSIKGQVSVAGDISIIEYADVDTGYELVTSDMGELQYTDVGENPIISGRLGGRPLNITMPEEFGPEFEKKVRRLTGY